MAIRRSRRAVKTGSGSATARPIWARSTNSSISGNSTTMPTVARTGLPSISTRIFQQGFHRRCRRTIPPVACFPGGQAADRRPVGIAPLKLVRRIARGRRAMDRPDRRRSRMRCPGTLLWTPSTRRSRSPTLGRRGSAYEPADHTDTELPLATGRACVCAPGCPILGLNDEVRRRPDVAVVVARIIMLILPAGVQCARLVGSSGAIG